MAMDVKMEGDGNGARVIHADFCMYTNSVICTLTEWRGVHHPHSKGSTLKNYWTCPSTGTRFFSACSARQGAPAGGKLVSREIGGCVACRKLEMISFNGMGEGQCSGTEAASFLVNLSLGSRAHLLHHALITCWVTRSAPLSTDLPRR